MTTHVLLEQNTSGNRNRPFEGREDKLLGNTPLVRYSLSIVLFLLLLVGIPSFVLSIQARGEFLRVEDKLNEVFPENEGDCNLLQLEETITISFVSAFRSQFLC